MQRDKLGFVPIAEAQQLEFFNQHYGSQAPPPSKTYAVLVLAVALVVIPWSLFAWLIWTATSNSAARLPADTYPFSALRARTRGQNRGLNKQRPAGNRRAFFFSVP